MKISAIRPALLAAVALIAATASAQTLKSNQTLGFGAGQLLTFTYLENFTCIDQPNDDLQNLDRPRMVPQSSLPPRTNPVSFGRSHSTPNPRRSRLRRRGPRTNTVRDYCSHWPEFPWCT